MRKMNRGVAAGDTSGHQHTAGGTPGKRTRTDGLPAHKAAKGDKPAPTGQDGLAHKSEPSLMPAGDDPYGMHLPQNGGSTATKGAEVPVTHDEVDQISEKHDLINKLTAIHGLAFEALRFALDRTVGGMSNPPHEHHPSKLMELVELAALASVAGGAEVIAHHYAARVGRLVVPFLSHHDEPAFVKKAVEDGIIGAVELGAKSADSSDDREREADLIRAFSTWQFGVIQDAQRQFILNYPPDDVKAKLLAMPIEDLRGMVRAAAVKSNDEELIEVAARQMAAKWSNLVAQVRYGAGNWDNWAGTNGSRQAYATSFASPPPDDLSVRGRRKPHSSDGNVDPDSEAMYDATDDDQRTFQPRLDGMIEINLFAEAGEMVEGEFHNIRFVLFTGHDHGMRLAGVSPHIKDLIRGLGRVRDANMNLVIAVFNSQSFEINPPKPVGRCLVTADGWGRHGDGNLKPDEITAAANYAGGLSLEKIK